MHVMYRGQPFYAKNEREKKAITIRKRQDSTMKPDPLVYDQRQTPSPSPRQRTLMLTPSPSPSTTAQVRGDPNVAVIFSCSSSAYLERNSFSSTASNTSSPHRDKAGHPSAVLVRDQQGQILHQKIARPSDDVDEVVPVDERRPRESMERSHDGVGGIFVHFRRDAYSKGGQQRGEGLSLAKIFAPNRTLESSVRFQNKRNVATHHSVAPTPTWSTT